MSRTPVGEKIFALASADTTMRSRFGVAPFRWTKWPTPQGYMPKVRGGIAPGGGSSSVTYRLISAISQYSMLRPIPIEFCRLQIDVMDLSPEVVDRAAFDVEAFFGSINLCTGQQFGSPVTVPSNYPNFLNNRREFETTQTGVIVYGISIDVQLYNSTLN